MTIIRYHLLNITAMLIFSYTASLGITSYIKYSLDPVINKKINIKTTSPNIRFFKPFNYYKKSMENNFFAVAEIVTPEVSSVSSTPSSQLVDLTLVGTVVGPSSIARALIKKRGEKRPRIFALRKFSKEITNMVYGNQLVSIDLDRVYLSVDGKRVPLLLFKKKKIKNRTSMPKNRGFLSGKRIMKTLSRAEMKQKILNNMDNALKGLIAGPYRINNVIVGYRLKKVSSRNILYKMGARSGDIIKRVNGHPLNSTQKLIKLWQNLKNESKITIDMERRGRPITFDFNIKQ